MESEGDEDNEEIGIQGADDDSKKTGGKKNWKQNLEEKKAAAAKQEEEKKTFQPPPPRQKTDRGDYVVTGFVIPDRSTKQEHVSSIKLI